MAVLPGNAQGALELAAQSERHTAVLVTETIADAAYGDGHTRQQCADAGRTLIAKVPKRPARAHFPKEDFQIDLAARTCTCPAGQVTRTGRRCSYTTATGARAPRRYFRFDAALCTDCPLRPRCVTAGSGRGRQVSLHPQEALLQARYLGRHKTAAPLYLTATVANLTPSRGTPLALGFAAGLTPAATSQNHREHACRALVPRSGPT